MPNTLKVIVAAVILNGFLWQLIIPVWHYPDEQAHFAQVQNQAELGKSLIYENDTSYEIALSEKVLLTERNSLGNNYFSYRPDAKLPFNGQIDGINEQLLKDVPIDARFDFVKREATHNPPAYYAFASIFYKLAYGGDIFYRVYAVRLFSLVLFALFCYVAFKTSIVVFGNNNLSYILTALVGFTPMLVYVSTGILPDPMTNLLMGLILYVALIILKQGITLKRLGLIAVLIVAGIYTRQQFLVGIPIVFFPLAWRALKNGKRFLLFVTLSVFLLFYVYIASFVAGNVPFVGLFTVPDAGIVKVSELVKKDLIYYFAHSAKEGYTQIFPWYWGVYKWLSLTLPMHFYQVIKVLLVVSFMGLLMRFIFVVRNRRMQWVDKSALFFVYATVVYYLSFIVWDYLFFKKNGYSFGFQGRYFFPLIVAHLTLLLIGWNYFWQIVLKKYSEVALLSLVLLFMLMNLYSLNRVSFSYYQVASFDQFIKNVSNYKPAALKNSTITSVLAANFILQSLLVLKLAKSLSKDTG